MGALKWPKTVFWVFLLSLASLLSITSLDSMRDELPLNKWSHLTARVYVNIIRPKNWGQLLSQTIRRHISQGKSLFSFNFWEESFNLGGLNKKISTLLGCFTWSSNSVISRSWRFHCSFNMGPSNHNYVSAVSAPFYASILATYKMYLLITQRWFELKHYFFRQKFFFIL